MDVTFLARVFVGDGDVAKVEVSEPCADGRICAVLKHGLAVVVDRGGDDV